MKDKWFNGDLIETERNAWLSFKRICKDFLGNHKAANYQDVVQTCWLRTKLWNAIWVWKSTFWSHTWIFSQKILAKSVRNTVTDFTRHCDYGKMVASKVDLKYVGRLLLDTEEGCTWRKIPAKVIRLCILEGSFCLSDEHVKYYFAHLNSSISLKTCLIEKFCIHIWIQHKKYCCVYLLKFVGQKKS